MCEQSLMESGQSDASRVASVLGAAVALPLKDLPGLWEAFSAWTAPRMLRDLVAEEALPELEREVWMPCSQSKCIVRENVQVAVGASCLRPLHIL
jgi:hypothetical protein